LLLNEEVRINFEKVIAKILLLGLKKPCVGLILFACFNGIQPVFDSAKLHAEFFHTFSCVAQLDRAPGYRQRIE